MKYSAQIDGFSFEITFDGTTDILNKNVVEYDVPFSDGAQLDSLGVKSRIIRFVAIFRRANYEMHEAFLAHASLDMINAFVHPVYGPLKGMIKTASVLNNDRINCAEIAVEFIVDATPDVQPVYQPDVQNSVEDDVYNLQLDQMTDFTDQLQTEIGTDASIVSAVELDPNVNILSQLHNISMKTRLYLGSVDTAMNAVSALMTEITNPADTIISSIEYGTMLPGRVIGGIAHTIERYAQAAVLASKSPVTFISSFKSGIQQVLAAAGPLQTDVLTTAAQIESLTLAQLYSIDDDNRNQLDRVERTRVWSADGAMRYNPDVPDVLNINQLENTLQTARHDIQSAIDAIRSERGSDNVIYGLKRIGAALLSYIDDIKLKRERIQKIFIENEMPVHLLCLQYGLPYMAAERVCAINDFWNPNFCQGDAKIYVR